MHVTLVINSLGAGGAERILTALADNLCVTGWTVSLITFSSPADPFYPLNPKIQHIPLGLGTKGLSLLGKGVRVLQLIAKLRSTIISLRPNVVLSFMDQSNMLALIALRKTTIPIIVAERVNPARSSITELPHPLSSFLIWLRRKLYLRASALVSQTSGASSYFSDIPSDKKIVIPNPVSLMPPSSSLSHPGQVIVTVGRLVRQKRTDLLIDAFSVIASKYPDWHLAIVGDGPLRKFLERRVQAHSIADRVSFLGVVQDIPSVFASAKIFALTSDYEGFPGALCEAMACGLAPVATDCSYGPSEVIRHRVDGLLVPQGDLKEITLALEELISNDNLREEFSHKAREITARFDASVIYSHWNSLLVRKSR